MPATAYVPGAAVIVKARITPLPENFLQPLPEVFVTYRDGTEEKLFSYYPDEISFKPEEFVGLTKDEAHKLKYFKDLAFLKS